ncbi:FtsX-like permease family protein [Luedemannella helvata]|uniref:ABC3 transporter permease C-terminal domain-containing protein n=1 Tax=Luedemannella helvata TaxID=349315 RepID=A0ABN2K746_9ACTN
MIALVLAMLRARRAQALTVLLLCAFTTGAAVAGPASLHAVDAAIVAHETADASATERMLTLGSVSSEGVNTSGEFSQFVPAVLQMPAFDQVYAIEISMFGFGSGISRVIFREDNCAHLTIERGRCAQGNYEVVIGARTAQRTGLGPGSKVTADEVRYNPSTGVAYPAGNPHVLNVVGTYTPTDPEDLYWGRAGYFSVDGKGERAEPVFMSRRTIGYINSYTQWQSIDAVLRADAVTADGLAELRNNLTVLTDRLGEAESLAVSTEIPALLDRIQASMDTAHTLVPVAFVPLVALCLFVIYLAVSYGTAGRRYELGLVALRGASPLGRWWLASGEVILMILLGVPVGYALGHAAVAFVAWSQFDAVVGPSLDTVPYALAALGGALVAAFFGLRRDLGTSVAELLRRVAGRGRAWRSVVLEVLVVALAVAAAIQLRGAGTGFAGIAALLPGLVIAAVALLAARAVVPLAGAVARAAMRRGRLGLGLAAVQLARRPGSHRLLVLLTVATALLGFAAAGVEVAAQARHDRATISVGATRVLEIDAVSTQLLLNATRSVDPDGAFAMAVAPTPQSAGELPGLAVDSTRLANVAQWRASFGPTGAAETARLLRPSAPQPFVLKARALRVDIENGNYLGGQRLEGKLILTRLSGAGDVTVSLGVLRAGRHTYDVAVPACSEGCRLAQVALVTDDTGQVDAVLFGISARGTAAPIIGRRELTAPDRWAAISDDGSMVRADGEGLRISGSGWLGNPLGARPVDAPVPLPIASTGEPPYRNEVSGFDGARLRVLRAAKPVSLPRLGSAGMLVDLEYLSRSAAADNSVNGAEVWLGPAAPADIVAKLRAAGLPVRKELGIAAEEASLAWQGSALALWFYVVAAGFGVLLAVGGIGLVAAVDRRRRADDLRYLRWQGLRRRDVRRAALWGNLTVVLAGAVLGLGAAALAWTVAGDQLPIFVDQLVAITPPRWPSPDAVLLPWAAATVLFAVAAAIVAAQLRRAVARNGSKGGYS